MTIGRWRPDGYLYSQNCRRIFNDHTAIFWQTTRGLDLGRDPMSLLRTQRPRKSTYDRGVVACAKCAAPIYVYKLKALPDEFSVRCTRCGDRSIYAKRAVSFETMPERRRKSRD